MDEHNHTLDIYTIYFLHEDEKYVLFNILQDHLNINDQINNQLQLLNKHLLLYNINLSFSKIKLNFLILINFYKVKVFSFLYVIFNYFYLKNKHMLNFFKLIILHNHTFNQNNQKYIIFNKVNNLTIINFQLFYL